MEKLTGKLFFGGCISLLKNFIGLQRENCNFSAHSQIPQVFLPFKDEAQTALFKDPVRTAQ